MQIFKKVFTVILKIFCKTPFYPYFLVFGNEKKTNEEVLRKFARGNRGRLSCGSQKIKRRMNNESNVCPFSG